MQKCKEVNKQKYSEIRGAVERVRKNDHLVDEIREHSSRKKREKEKC